MDAPPILYHLTHKAIDSWIYEYVTCHPFCAILSGVTLSLEDILEEMMLTNLM